MNSINTVMFRMSPWSIVYLLQGWITQKPYISSRLKMFLKYQLWQNHLPHTLHVRFLQNVCFIYCFVYYFSRRKILHAGSSLHLAQTKPHVVQSLAVFHLKYRVSPRWKRMWDLIVWSPHQAEGAWLVPCNPKLTSTSWTQLFLEWQWKWQNIKFTWPHPYHWTWPVQMQSLMWSRKSTIHSQGRLSS